MSYGLQYDVSICWIPDGAGQMAVPSSQVLTLGETGFYLPVPGGDAPTQANFNTALSGSSATPTAGSASADISAQIALALARIQGFATGGD